MSKESLPLKFQQGFTLSASDSDFTEGLRAVVDYRGDVSIQRVDGSQIVGYIFSADPQSLDMFPRDSSRKETVMLADIQSITFSGEDTAKGKSWEEWMKKKHLPRQDSASPTA
jgi:hypothetical protein